MAIAGNLAEFSLPEVFKFLEQRHATGLLSIYEPAGNSAKQRKVNYIWLQQGKIIAAADRLDGLSLVSAIAQRGWVSPLEIAEVLAPYPLSTIASTGLLLIEKGVLTVEQLKLLFYVQVLRPVCSLFKLQFGYYAFDSMADCPWQEMTGISLSARLATLLALRVLRDWAPLANKLPAPTSIMCQAASSKPHFKLDSLEWQVWQLVDSKLDVEAIAQQLKLPLKTIQQIAYRLSIAGLLEEASILAPTINADSRRLPKRHSNSQPASFLAASAA